MKRLSFSFLIVFILLLTIVHSCSTEEEETIAPIVQTPEPEPPVPTQYSLTVTAGEGGTVSTEGGTYDEGTELEITATPIEGYRFTGWEGNDSTSESLTVTLSSNQTLQAIFELLPVDSDGDGVTDSLDEFPFNSLRLFSKSSTSFFSLVICNSNLLQSSSMLLIFFWLIFSDSFIAC